MERPQQLQDWLEENDADEVTHIHGFGFPTMTFFVIKGVQVILSEDGEDGWEIFIPASPSNNIKATLEEASRLIARKA